MFATALRAVLAALSFVLLAAQANKTLQPDPPKRCQECDDWNAPHEPFRVFGNTYYVGTAGVAAVLITSPEGLILLDAGLAQSASLIDASIRKLDFKTEDIKLIVNSHAHFDHVGGIAALQRLSGAIVAASSEGAKAIAKGEPLRDDPQYAFGSERNRFPRVRDVRVVQDGEALHVGEVAIYAHLTPGHTPGSTAWTWRTCEGERCLNMVYADSLNPVSAPGFRFGGDGTHPGVEATLRRSIAKVRDLPCDVLLTVHPDFPGMDEKRESLKQYPQRNPFVDPQACRTYAADAAERLDRRLKEERSGSVEVWFP